MVQLYITEVRKSVTGEYEHENYWVFDENENKARLKAESKFHEVLSQAAVSEFAEHGAILFTSQCVPLMHQFYTHN